MSKKKIPWNCYMCGKEFLIATEVYNKLMSGKQKTACCSQECNNKRKNTGYNISCKNCGKIFYRRLQHIKRQENHFCSTQCEFEYKSKEARENRKCEICGEEFITFKKSNQRFCSNKCNSLWQTTIIGEDNPNYKRISMNCSWCNKEIKVSKYKLKINKYHFCNIKCSRDWYANIYSQTDEWKEISRERAVKLLVDNENNKSKRETKPQKIINTILEELNISYQREYLVEYYAIDNYLNKSGLMIEVNGDYWHCNPIKFSTKINKMQMKTIRSDKAKHTYILKYYRINILYLWENDIVFNKELCKKLIQKYISNNGMLKNYNSFNYELKNGEIELKQNIILSYQEQEFINYENLLV